MRVKRLAAAIFLLTALAACDTYYKLAATKIRDIIDHPRDYENKDVTVYGTVTGSSSLVFVKFFELQDDTGSIKIVTNRVLPQNGEKIRVKGRMESIEFGLQRTIVLREIPNQNESRPPP
ncbi:MAG TPA: hypothetical protein VKH64_01460 [Candidatus Binatia bacterium]|nr:hypothetical protein [Candidatus Binatia bacterium]